MGRSLFVTQTSVQGHSLTVTVRADLGESETFRGPPRSDSGAPVEFDFETLYDEQFDLVWRTLRRLGVAPDALDDALQDVFLVVHRKLDEFEQRSSVRTWIFGITLRVASDYVRRGRRHQPALPLDAEVHDERAPDPLEQCARSEATELLYALLGELDPDKRAAFVLAELEEMTIYEIALAVGANVNTVSSRVKAGRRQFEAALRRLRAKEQRRSLP
jgi:RNA polymerase sigma-70 factor, ECF subfamily